MHDILNGLFPILVVDSGDDLLMLSEVSDRLGSSHLAVIDYAYLFAPIGLLENAIRHHLLCRNGFTPISGIPRNIAPKIFASALIKCLIELNLPTVADASLIVEDLLLGSDLMGIECPLPFAAVPFSPLSDDDGAMRRPSNISFDSPSELQLLRHVADSVPFDGLHWKIVWTAWQIQAIKVRQDQRNRYLASEFPHRRLRTGKEQKKVLFISNPSSFSGGEMSLCQLISKLDRTRFALFALVGAEGSFSDRLRDLSVEVFSPGWGFDKDDADNYIYVNETINTVDPDVIHFNSYSGRPALYAAIGSRIPIVTHCRNYEISNQKELLEASSHVIAISQFTKNKVLDFELSEESISVIHNEVDVDLFNKNRLSRRELRNDYHIPQEAKALLMIARFVPRKRHDLLLRAARQARERVPNLFVILVGDLTQGAIMSEIREGIANAQAENWLCVIPFVNDIRNMHAMADVLVLCAEDEALGRCIVEAMAMELPTIVANAGGAPEIIENGVNGFLIPPNDHIALSEKIVEVLNSPDDLWRIKQNARSYAEDRLDARHSASLTMKLYDTVILENEKRLQMHNDVLCGP